MSRGGNVEADRSEKSGRVLDKEIDDSMVSDQENRFKQ